MSFKTEVVIDCRGHLLGRLASVVAKEVLNGQRVVCVRTEDINISGSLFRNKLKFAEFRRKKMSSNPKQGPLHYRAPAKIFWRTVRGMVPHKTPRGAAALDRLKTYEGIPHPYDRKKRMVVPACLKVLRIRPERKFCKLGDLSDQNGWKHAKLVERLEGQRKVKSAAFHKKKTTATRAFTKAQAAAKLDKADAISKTGIQGNQENIESLSAALEILNKKHSSLSDAVKSDKAAFDSHVQKHGELVQELKERHERFKAFEAESLESNRKFCASLSNLESRILQIQGNMAQNRAEAQKTHDDSVRVLSDHLEVHDEKLRNAAETFQEHDRRLSLQQEQVVECGENTSKLVKHSDQKRIMDVQSLRNEVDQTSADNSRNSRLISQLQDIIYVRPPSGDAKNHVETLLADMSMTLRRATRLEGLLGLDPLTEDGDDDAGKMVNGILLSNSQIEDFKKSFSAFDSNNSGSISVSELNNVLKTLGYELEDDMVELIVRDIDPDHSGEIVFDEFCSMMSKMLGPDGKVDVNGYLRHLAEQAKRDAKQNQMTELLPILKRDVEQHTSVIQLEQSKLSNTTQRVRSLESDQSALALEVDKLRKGVNANNEYWKGLSQGLKETKRTVTIHGDGAMLPSPTNLRNLPPLELRASTSPSNATRSARS